MSDLVAVRAGGEHGDVAAQPSFAFGLRQSSGVAADIGRSVEDPDWSRPRVGEA